MKIPKILAPAGDVAAFKAAIVAGADEIYFGLPKFNARMNATNITTKDLGHLMRLAHLHGVRGFLTVNVLFAEYEFPELIETVGRAFDAGVDGLIIQDYGAFRLLLSEFPGAELHASTQMTTHNTGQVSLLAYIGASRVNLSRELTLHQIESITRSAHDMGIETEVFVHGAYCVSFSGQCYMSSFIAGLSGNRGLCFQPCRRRYFLESVEKAPQEADRAVRQSPWFPLSLKDNNALPYAADLIGAGVDSLKIEGRMKNAHYVCNVVSAWRQRLDSIAAGEEEREDGRLFEVFNRGFTAGYLEGAVSGNMFGDTPFDHSLQAIGRVERFHADRMVLTVSLIEAAFGGPATRLTKGRTTRPAPAGADSMMRLLANGKSPDAVLPAEEILIVSETNRRRCRARLVTPFVTSSKSGPAGGIDLHIKIINRLEERIQPDDVVLWGRDAQKAQDISARIDRLTFEPLKVQVSVTGSEGAPLEALFRTSCRGKIVETRVFSTGRLEPARNISLTAEDLKRQFGKLGGTMFALEGVIDDGLEPGLFLPVSELNAMRRSAVLKLERAVVSSGRLTGEVIDRPRRAEIREIPAAGANGHRAGNIGVLVSHPEDGEGISRLLETGDRILLEVGDPHVFPNNNSFLPYFPLVTMDDAVVEYGKLLDRFDKAVINNAGLAVQPVGAHGRQWIAGQGFNITNTRALSALADAGAAGGFLSTEISLEQISAALNGSELSRDTEVWLPVFGPITLMTTFQCLSQKACAKKLQDAGCYTSCNYSATFSSENRNKFHVLKRPWFYTTIFNSLPLSLPRAVRDLINDVDYFVLDLRRLPPLELSSSARADIFRIFQKLRRTYRTAAGKNSGEILTAAHEEIRRIVGDTTWGNYRRGLSSGDEPDHKSMSARAANEAARTIGVMRRPTERKSR